MSNIAVITARGGSQGIKHKNVVKCAGQPLIFWTVRAALMCRLLDSVILDTDSDTIASVFAECVEYMNEQDARCSKKSTGVYERPARLATPEASHAEVMRDFILHWSAGLIADDDLVAVLQPTSPLRRPRHIDESLALIADPRYADAVVSGTECEHPPEWCAHIDGGFWHFSQDLNGEHHQRQQSSGWFRPNGAIFASRAADMYRGGFYDHTILAAYVMDKTDSYDIDDHEDLFIADTLLRERFKGMYQ